MSIPSYTQENLEGVYEQFLVVKDSMTDTSGTMQIGDFARILEQITERHLDFYGAGKKMRDDYDRMWVILWNSLEIIDLPIKGEPIILRIWPGKNKAGMYTRRYALYTEKGEALAGASALFMLMDRNTRTMADAFDKLQQIPVITLSEEPKLPKMQVPFPDVLNHETTRIVQKEEIDKNGHLNNAHYLDWVNKLYRTINPNKMAVPKTVWISYQKELMENDTVTLQYEYTNQTLYVVGKRGDEVSFSAVLCG